MITPFTLRVACAVLSFALLATNVFSVQAHPIHEDFPPQESYQVVFEETPRAEQTNKIDWSLVILALNAVIVVAGFAFFLYKQENTLKKKYKELRRKHKQRANTNKKQ